MLIDISYFTKGPRQIQNATLGTLPNAGTKAVTDAVEAYIAAFQKQFLVDMFGDEAGNRINSYLVCMDEDEPPKHNENYDMLCERLREPFADYVFYHILRDANSQSTMNGLVRLKSANEYVSPICRQVNIWNDMVNKNRLISGWCFSNECPFADLRISTDMLSKINTLNL